MALTPGTRLGAYEILSKSLFRAESVANYDVTADGSRFLVGTPTDTDRESQVHVIVNWIAEFRRER